jgi:hypothetical protein
LLYDHDSDLKLLCNSTATCRFHQNIKHVTDCARTSSYRLCKRVALCNVHASAGLLHCACQC